MANAHTFKITWPVDGKEVDIRVEPKYYIYLRNHRPNDFVNVKTVFEVLHNPNRIFSGLNRPYSDSDKKLCVVGKPRFWYVGKNYVQAPFPPECVYVVFLSERMSVFEFGREEPDPKDPLSPIDYENRFRKLIWQKHS